MGTGPDDGGGELPVVVAGTRNPAKVEAYGRLVAGLARVAVPPDGVEPDWDEAGGTVEAVAAAKAAAWSRALGPDALVLAGDGGLLVPALGPAWDPLRTRRFAGPAAHDRADALLALAVHLTAEERRIGWREAVAFARGGRPLAVLAAESPPGLLVEGYDRARLPAAGFWVPHLWRCPEFGGMLLADLTPEQRAARPDHWDRLRGPVREALGGIDSRSHDRPGQGVQPRP